MSAQQQAEPVGFGDVGLGDRLVFATRDNGFGGTGDLIDRTGVVTSTTEKTVTVELDNPAPIRAFEGGKARTYGLTARLRAADWYGRSVRRLEKAQRRPYRAESVQIIDGGWNVTALYIPDPEQALDPAHVLENILDYSKYENVEVVAEATKLTKKDGADFPGWIVRSGLEHTDPLENKVVAMQHVRDAVTRHFSR